MPGEGVGSRGGWFTSYHSYQTLSPRQAVHCRTRGGRHFFTTITFVLGTNWCMSGALSGTKIDIELGLLLFGHQMRINASLKLVFLSVSSNTMRIFVMWYFDKDYTYIDIYRYIYIDIYIDIDIDIYIYI